MRSGRPVGRRSSGPLRVGEGRRRSGWSRGALRRMAALVFGAASCHLLLLWLWNPRVSVPAPLDVAGKAKIPPRQSRDSRRVVVLLGDTAPADAALPLLQQYGYEYPYTSALDLLREGDLTIANLETVVSREARAFPLYKRYSYRADPAALQAMAWAGIDAVSLANNHIMDYGPGGLIDTVRELRAVGLVPIGAGDSVAAARRGVVFELKGTRVGVLSYLEDSLMHSLYVRSFAWGDSPVAPASKRRRRARTFVACEPMPTWCW